MSLIISMSLINSINLMNSMSDKFDEFDKFDIKDKSNIGSLMFDFDTFSILFYSSRNIRT